MVTRPGKPARISDKIRAEVVAAVKAGGTCRGVARQFGMSPASVKRFVEDAGLPEPFERNQTKNATDARLVDLAAKRTALAQAFLDDAEKLRARAWSEYKFYERGQFGPELVSLELPMLRDVREAYTAAGIAVDKHLKLIEFDSGDTAAGAKSMLNRLADALSVAADSFDEETIES